MRINHLLTHRATLIIPGGQNGRDEYNRPIFSNPTTKQIKCRLDQIRQQASTDEDGTDVVVTYVLYADPNESFDTNMQITNVVDDEDRVVVDGSFTIEDIIPSYRMSSLHHFELNLSNIAQQPVSGPIYNEPIVETEVVTFAGKTSGDGDQSKQIFFGLSYE